jgi:hypothetical protein
MKHIACAIFVRNPQNPQVLLAKRAPHKAAYPSCWDLGVAELAAGIFGSKNWMSELARFAGSRTSVRKANSSRQNGKRGGRPRLQKSS